MPESRPGRTARPSQRPTCRPPSGFLSRRSSSWNTLTRLLGRNQREVLTEVIERYANGLRRTDRETLQRLMKRKD